MDPQNQFCPNPDCSARGKIGEGNIVIHSQKEKRYQCKTCGATFSATKGTPFYRLHKGWELMKIAIILLSHGCPPKAIVAAYGVDERTVASWQEKAGTHAQKLHEHLVENQQVELGQVQADELKAKLVGTMAWMAMALSVSSRLWLGGVISTNRDQALIDGLLKHIKACARSLGLILFCVDGLASYVSGMLKVFRIPIRNGRRGRPKLVSPEGLMVCQVVKRRVKRRVVGVVRKLVRGDPTIVQLMLALTQGGSQINTAYIERLNASFRSVLAPLVRRGRAVLHQTKRLEAAMYLIGCAYNFCWVHESLKVTPAMAAGLTDHRWSMEELLWCKVPPAPALIPRRRGRPPGRKLVLEAVST
jgi:transposase-like protein